MLPNYNIQILYNNTYGVQSSEMCIACASTHAPNTRPPSTTLCTVPQTHKSLHIASHRDYGETKDKKQWYYLPNSSTSPKTVFRTWFSHPLKYVVSAPNSGYRFSIGYFGYLDIAFNVRSPQLTTNIIRIVNQYLIGWILGYFKFFFLNLACIRSVTVTYPTTIHVRAIMLKLC